MARCAQLYAATNHEQVKAILARPKAETNPSFYNYHDREFIGEDRNFATAREWLKAYQDQANEEYQEICVIDTNNGLESLNAGVDAALGPLC